MKVLFLDCDGVLNNWDTPERFGGFIGIDKTLLPHLMRIIAETKCEIVLSSTWRLNAQSKQHVFDTIGAEYIFGETNDHGRTHYNARPGEVREWVEANRAILPIDRYAILDDDFDFNDDQPLFRTSMSVGLTDEIAQQVIDYLNGDEEYVWTE